MSRRTHERQRAQHKAAKNAERQERLRRRRRDRNIALILIFGLVASLTVGAIVLAQQSPSDTPAQLDPDAEPTAPLPTTNPQLYEAAPPATDSLDQTWHVELDTSAGTIAVELDGLNAPQAVASFVFLAGQGFYDGTACHRLLVTSLLQCGDPTATGTSDAGYRFGPIENAPEDQVYPEGTIAMARSGGDGESMGSQFFLVFNDVTLPGDAAGGYTVMGRITEGLDVLREIAATGTYPNSERPAEDVVIQNVEIK